MKKIRFIAPTREALGRLKDYLVSLKLRGHGNWNLGEPMDDADGNVHLDVVSYQEDPEFNIDRLGLFIPSGVTAEEVPVDTKPSEPVTTSRKVEAKTSFKLRDAVLAGQDPVMVVEEFTRKVLADTLQG